MRPFFLFLVTVSILFSCSGNTRNVNLQKEIKKESSKSATEILFDNPEVIDSSHIVIYPLVLEESSHTAFSSGGNREITSYWNLVFYNTDNKQRHLLVPAKKVVITSFDAQNSSSSKTHKYKNMVDIYENNIFYEAIAKDYNQNEYLDANDPTYLFVSDKQGNNFRQLSPDDYNVRSWTVVRGTSKIILQTQKDNNNDKKFDGADKIIPMIVDVNAGKIADETFDQAYIDTLKSTLLRTWKPTKK